jgi:CelD/BcsL family acetyltransferase involved in cellulose biosynthesis
MSQVARSTPHADLTPLADLDAGQIARWRELVDRAAEPNPFFEPDFVLPAAAALHDGVSLLVARDGDGWCGCLPVHSAARARSWGHAPVRGLVAWTHLYSFLGTPLLRAGSEVPATRALVQRGSASGFLGFDVLRAEGPVAAALREACDGAVPLVAFAQTQRAALRRAEDGWSLRLSGKRRREQLRQRRRLTEAAGGDVRTVDRAGDAEAVESFLRLEAAGWKAVRRTALRSRPAHAEFFRNVCRAFAERGRLQLLSLEAGGEAYAMLCSFVAGDTLFEFKITFDERHARFGPGIQIEADAVEMMDSALPQVRLLDTCADPANEMANALFPDRIPLETVAVPEPGLRGRRNVALLKAALKTRNAIRRLR